MTEPDPDPAPQHATPGDIPSDGVPHEAASADALRMAELLVHLGRAARGEEGGNGSGPPMTAAQWTALRFFDKANCASRTPSAFAEFHATTRGTASQTIKSLVARGLLERYRAEHDRRSVCFELTQAGRALLRQDPLRHLARAIARLGPESRAALARILPDLVAALAQERGAQAFGTCDSCDHYEHHGEGGYCACVAMSLAPIEIGRLCMRFLPRAEADGARPPAVRPGARRACLRPECPRP